jgi:hypothetical protein
MDEDPLFIAVNEDGSHVFTNTDDFYHFMSENNGQSIISIEKYED